MSPAGWMVKAQVFQGHRGQRGGIESARDFDEVESLAVQMTERRFAGERVKSVYVEERLEKERELYVAALVDRDRGCVRVLASAHGGVDIESVPAQQIVSVDVDPLIGLRTYQTGLLTLKLGLREGAGSAFQELVGRLYAALVAEDAELIEINPLLLTSEGKLVAADAKVILDDDAMSRHTGRSQPAEWQADGDFMRRMRDLGAIGVDMRPHWPAADLREGRAGIAVLCNGAGVTMATFDLVTDLGGRVSGAVEMHGALAAGADHTASVVEGLRLLEPAVVLINGFYQLRACDTFAEAIVAAVNRRPTWIDPDRVVVRMRGVKEREAIRILEAAGCRATGSLPEACSLVVELSRATAVRSLE